MLLARFAVVIIRWATTRMPRRWENVASAHQWPVTLTHEAITLRPICRRDRTEWERVRRKNLAWLTPWDATLPEGSPPGPPSFPALVRALGRQAREKRMLPWVLAYQPGQAEHSRGGSEQGPSGRVLAGQVTVSGIVGGSASWAQIGYWVDQQWAGRGLIPTAVALATDYCFSTLRLHRIEIAIRPENVKSLRVVNKLGFRPEGLRPRYLHIDGDWRDHLIFALTTEEVPEGLLQRWRGQQP